MKTRAPELSALIIIFRSGGPVISQRRSRRSGGAGATFQPFGSGEDDEGERSGDARAARRCEQCEPLGVQLAVEPLDEAERGRREDLPVAGRVNLDSRRHQAAADSNCSSSVEPRSASVEDSPPLTISATRSK